MKRLAVIGVRDGWSSRILQRAARERGCECALLETAGLTAELERGRVVSEGVVLNDLDAVIVKKLAGEYSPTHLQRLELLRVLNEAGVPVFSRPAAIAGVIDRLSCTATLAGAGIPLPPTVVTEDAAAAAIAVRRFGTAVLKPLFTSKARGMRLLEAGPALMEELAAFQREHPGVFYLQKRIELPGRDLGVVFLGGEYLASYARVAGAGSWNTTTADGGRYARCEPEPAVIELGRRAQALFGLDFTCVDIAETPTGPVVFEVSAFGGFRGLAETQDINAAELYVDYVLERIDG